MTDHRHDLDERAAVARQAQQRAAVDRREHPGGPEWVISSSVSPAIRGGTDAAPSATGCTSAITRSVRCTARKIPPICVLSNARWTSAMKTPKVANASSRATPTVSAEAMSSPERSASRPIAPSANIA